VFMSLTIVILVVGWAILSQLEKIEENQHDKKNTFLDYEDENPWDDDRNYY